MASRRLVLHTVIYRNRGTHTRFCHGGGRAGRVCGRVLEVVRLAPVHKHIDQHGPCTVAVIVHHVVVDLDGKVQQQVPRVARDRPLVVLLIMRGEIRTISESFEWSAEETHPEELAPEIDELEASPHHNVPVGDGRFQV